MKSILFLIFIFSLPTFANSSMDCNLNKSIELPSSNLFDLWPKGSDISKKVIIKTFDENGQHDWLEISVFNENRESDNTWGSPGQPSDYIYAMWGTISGVKPNPAFIKFPGERVNNYFTPSEYIKDIHFAGENTHYKLGNRSKYVCRDSQCILGDHLQYLNINMTKNRINSIELVQSYIHEVNGHVVWKEHKYCVQNAILSEITEWQYNKK